MATKAASVKTPIRKDLTVHRFISMLHKAGLGAKPMSEEKPKEKEPECVPNILIGKKRKREDNSFVVTKLLDYTMYEPDDREDWLKWRKEQKLPSASMVSAYFGHGYRSLNMEIKDILGLVEEKPTDPFTQKMFDHGNQYENSAKHWYLVQSGHQHNYEWIANGSTSYMFEISHNNKTCNVLATPDMVVTFPETAEHAQHNRVVEIKCPTYGILMKKKPFPEVVEDFKRTYPYGKPGHFLQAATYALVFECKYFDLFYYFTDTINTAWIKISYELKDEVKEALFGAIHYCSTYIERANEIPASAGYPAIKKATGKQGAVQFVSNAYLESRVYFMPVESQEDASDESKEDGPEIPGEPSCGN